MSILKSLFRQSLVLVPYFVLFFISMITGCQIKETTEIFDADIFIKKIIENRTSENLKAEGKIIFQIDSMVFIEFGEKSLETTKYYTIIQGANNPRSFNDTSASLVPIKGITADLGFEFIVLSGGVSKMSDISGDGFEDFLVTERTSESGRNERSYFIIRTSSNTLLPSQELILETHCASCGDTGMRMEYEEGCVGHITDFMIVGGNDGTIPQIIVHSFDVLADAQCNNWIGNPSKRAYQWLGSPGMDFVFLADLLEPDVEIQEPGNDSYLDELLQNFLGSPMVMLAERDAKKVRYLPCDGGIPKFTFIRQDGVWYLEELGPQDQMTHTIRSAEFTEGVYYLETTNPDVGTVEMSFDADNNIMYNRERPFTLDPDSYELVEQSPCE